MLLQVLAGGRATTPSYIKECGAQELRKRLAAPPSRKTGFCAACAALGAGRGSPAVSQVPALCQRGLADLCLHQQGRALRSRGRSCGQGLRALWRSLAVRLRLCFSVAENGKEHLRFGSGQDRPSLADRL